MYQSIRTIRLRVTAFLAIQLLVIATFFCLWHYNLWGLQSVIDIPILLIILLSFCFFDTLVMLLTLRQLARIRHRSDLKAAEIIGRDIQEAYSFGMIGLIIIDEKGTIVWTNEFMVDRQIHIIDVNVYEWQKDLLYFKEHPESNETIKIKINSNMYRVKYLPAAQLFILKDVEDFESLYTLHKNEGVVVGMIMIDNYSDVTANSDENNDHVIKIRQALIDYSKKYNMLIKRLRPDTYICFCYNKDFALMRDKDQFSILDQIREINSDETNGNPLTLSMGFAHDFPDIVKLSETATSAIDVAMSRGGDQVVVCEHGSDMQFFGGKSEAIEKRNKVKVRNMANSFVALVRSSSNVLILGHTDMDMDCLGSALGIKALCDSLNQNALIVYDSKKTEAKTKGTVLRMFSKEEISRTMISPHDCLDKLKPNTLVVVVDVHRPSMTIYPKLLQNATRVAVIDHHRRSEEFVENPVFTYLEPSASSASELVTELFRFTTVDPKPKMSSTYATIMLSGIFLDTNFYRAKTTGMRTFDASMALKEFGADTTQADYFLKDEYEEVNLRMKMMANPIIPFPGILIYCADEEMYIDRAMLSKVANQGMQIKDMNACFVIGNTGEKETRISARSDGTVNVQFLMEKLHGGGHFTMAAALFNNSSISEVTKKLKDVLNDYLSQATTK